MLIPFLTLLRRSFMLILIAESKTMTACSAAVKPSDYNVHTPIFEARTDDIMMSLRDCTPAELAASVKISLSLAARLQHMIYEFPNKGLGGRAVSSFTGVVFRALDYASLTDSARKDFSERVRIISSLYGCLRPDDIIKQYRFDFNTRLAPGNCPFSSYWRDRVTDSLITDIKHHGFTDVLDLLPADAACSIDWKRIGALANVWKANFRELQSGNRYKTPHANRLKTLRGLLLRQIIVENALSPKALVGMSSDHYIVDNIDDSGRIVISTVSDI